MTRLERGRNGAESCSGARLWVPYQMSFLDVSSSTILLSEGDRPVFFPEYAVRAPVDEMPEPGSYT